MDKNYKGVIWTNHALKSMKKRGIKQGDAWATFNRPDQSRYAKVKGAWIYYKTYKDTRIEVVARRDKRKQWVIVSVWSKKVGKKKAANKPSLFNLLKKLFS